MQRFYVTTPIYYVNDKPHIGSAYTTINADILARYYKLFGYEARFLTGTDEHGQKVQQAAEARGKTPQEHCDEMAQNFIRVWDELNIDYDVFFRTTDAGHKKTVQDCLQELFDRGEIYEDTYEGWYCVSDETFHTEKELVDGKSPSGKPVEKISEKNYFFKMSAYQEKLIKFYEDNPKAVQPDHRRNEVLGFLKQPLGDLCISRPKTRLKWGIELPFDKDYVTYVWFDALLNYANSVGFKQKGREADYDKWWPAVHHLIGKDILTTHTVYWPTMLMALGAQPAKMVFAHGWLLNKDSEKMSKSKGEVINPLDMKDVVGVDALRYYLVRDVHFGNDSPISQDLIVSRVNTELANNLGNLLSRSTNLINKYYDTKCPGSAGNDESTLALIEVAKGTAAKVREEIENMRPSYALEHIVNLLNEANRFLEEKAPWKTAKEDLKTAGESLYAAVEVLRIAGILLTPVMPTKGKELLNRIGCPEPTFENAKQWGLTPEGTKIVKCDPLFPRIQ